MSLNQYAYSVGMISDISYTGMVSILCELSCVTSNYPSLRMISDMSYTGMVSCFRVCDELMFKCKGFTADINHTDAISPLCEFSYVFSSCHYQ